MWRGPLEFDVAADPVALLHFVQDWAGVSDVYVDSVKNLAAGLSSDEVGAAVNTAFQHLIAQGYQVASNHHQRKAQAGNKTPNTLDDVYGSNWITGGQGSVLLLYGQPGDEAVLARHLKQPADEVPDFGVSHDHARGHSEPTEPPSPSSHRHQPDRERSALLDICAALNRREPLNTRELRDATTISHRDIGRYTALAIERRYVRVEKKGSAHVHHLTDEGKQFLKAKVTRPDDAE